MNYKKLNKLIYNMLYIDTFKLNKVIIVNFKILHYYINQNS